MLHYTDTLQSLDFSIQASNLDWGLSRTDATSMQALGYRPSERKHQ